MLPGVLLFARLSGFVRFASPDGRGYTAGMNVRYRPLLIRLAAALVALQALWSGLAGAAYAAGIDEAKYLCNAIALDARARAEIAELLAATGLEDDRSQPVLDAPDCPACALGHAAALSASAVLQPLDRALARVATPLRIDQAGPRQTTGPPVGLRAPPFQS